MGLEGFYIPGREYEERTNNLLMTFHWILKEKDGENRFCLASEDEAETTMDEILRSPVINIDDNEVSSNLLRGVRIDWIGVKICDMESLNIEAEVEPNNTGKKRKAFLLYKEEDMWRVKIVVQNNQE